MSKLVYTGPHDALEIPSVRLTAVRDGDPIDVPDELAKELVARGDFKSADKPAAKRGEKE